MRIALALALLLGGAAPAIAQSSIPADAYLDVESRELVRQARARRAVVDTRITAYEVIARERVTARVALAGIERLLLRRETVSRIDWSPDTVRIELLGAREAQPLMGAAARHPPPDLAGYLPVLAFDPVDSEMLMRFDSTSIRHPLALESERFYRFSAGDSTSIRLADGRTVRLRELRFAAREPSPRFINGSFWIDTDSHALVRAGFRLSRGFSSAGSGVSVLSPEVTGELDHVAIEYGLWDLHWWLPRAVVARGVIRVAGVRLPLSYERSYDSYRVEGDPGMPTDSASLARQEAAERPCRPRRTSVSFRVDNLPSDTVRRDSIWNEAWDRSAREVSERPAASDGEDREICDRVFIVTRQDEQSLVSSEVFTTSIYDDEGGPFADEDLQELARLVRLVPGSPWMLGRPALHLLTPDLVRINRVEGLSLGARAVLPFGPAQMAGELRVGTTGEIGARLFGVHSDPRLRTELGAYRAIQVTDIASHPFTVASSIGSLLLGRDENDYFRGSGLELLLSPAYARSQSWDLRLFAERQQPVRSRTDLSLRGLLDGGFQPRSNVDADPIDQAGATLGLRAARGDDPARLRTHAELELHAETGDMTFARTLLRLGANRMLPGGFGFGAGISAGTAIGEVPLQRNWQIGGSASVRGHDPASMRGESVWLVRGELNRGSPAFRFSMFGDAGWAGDHGDLWSATPVRGAGVGVSLLDNLLRLELARGIGGGGYRLHLRMGGAL